MIQKTNLSEQYLSDWMSDQITDAQFQCLVSTEDFMIYQKIKSGSSQLKLGSPDMEQNWLELSQKLTQTQKKSQPKVSSLWKYVGIAASMLLLFGVYQFFGYTQSAIADIGSTKSVLLPDKSVVVLNSQSSIAYSKMFAMHRKIKLDGAAYFEVEKGKVFTVKTAYGEVEVLGTKFEVIARPDWFEVTCFEGKVKVKSEKMLPF
jgi:transmembrane sensor